MHRHLGPWSRLVKGVRKVSAFLRISSMAVRTESRYVWVVVVATFVLHRNSSCVNVRHDQRRYALAASSLIMWTYNGWLVADSARIASFKLLHKYHVVERHDDRWTTSQRSQRLTGGPAVIVLLNTRRTSASFCYFEGTNDFSAGGGCPPSRNLSLACRMNRRRRSPFIFGPRSLFKPRPRGRQAVHDLVDSSMNGFCALALRMYVKSNELKVRWCRQRCVCPSTVNRVFAAGESLGVLS